MKYLLSMLLIVASFFIVSCDSNDPPKTVPDALLDYEKIETVTYNLRIVSSCEACVKNNVGISGLHVEIRPKDNPLANPLVFVFDNVGSHNLKNLSALKGQTFEITGNLFLDQITSPTEITTKADIKAPDEDDSEVEVQLKFQPN